jgi:molecular chaperone DnaJ
MRNLYEVLGVARDADQATIRKAFRTLARRHHPDVCKEPDAEKRFKEINAAYQVLSDEEKRSLYDEFGEDSLRQGFNAEAARAWRSAGRRPSPSEPFFHDAGGQPGGSGLDFEDILLNMFRGGGATGARPDRARPRVGPNLESTKNISFLEALEGGEVLVSLRRPGRCPSCGGEGGSGRKSCAACGGSGQVRRRRLGMDAVVLCDECAGSGESFAQECPTCAGSGRVTQKRQVRVHIPAGIRNGQTVRLRGQGGEGQGGGPPGDLLLNIAVSPHPFLRLCEEGVEMDLPLSVGEALAGARITVPTLDGDVKLQIPAGSGNGRRLRVRGKGAPDAEGKRGDLYLVLRPTVPPNPPPEAVEKARELDLLLGDVGGSLREKLLLRT